jgi:D-alanyl-D-alanine carboxypeptidase/D-alanyl-D-alanine-endopeptidase (penicillin-binding protein 4)
MDKIHSGNPVHGIFGTLAYILFLVPVTGSSATMELPVPRQSALNFRNVPDESLSIYVEDLRTGEVILSFRDAEPRNPASVEKMLTTLVALDALGPTYTWKTDVHLMGEVQDGVLDGDLLLKGFGDPYLVTERLWQLTRKIRQSGIRMIDGNLRVDDSYFDVGDYDPAAFDREPLRAYNVSPNALLTNFKVIRFFFEPNESYSGVDITLEPALGNIEIENKLKLVSGTCRGYQRGINITPDKNFARITFSGNFPDGCDHYVMDRSALGHNEFAFGLFRFLWEESGGEISGGLANSILAVDAEPWFSFESLPLSEVITKLNKHSTNVMARQLLFTLGAEKFGPPGTEEKGRQFVNDWLLENGMNSAELKLGNGAGLSRDSRMTARQLGDMLRFAYRNRYMPEYLSSLSISGLDGTLSRRFRNGSLTGMAHIKTGSLDHVSAFAGYFQSRSGKRYIVVTLQNYKNVHRGPGQEVQESLLRWLYDL